MEEDIKYTEDLIALAKILPIGELKIQEKEIEVLEHLIKAYKELEEGNRYLKTHIIYPEIIKLNYIPVSLVKEKIEELSERN